MAAYLEHRRRGRPRKEADPNYDGSTPLATPRRELFCCYAAKLGNLTDAYIAARYTCASRSVASRNGSRLRSREPGVRERIEYLAQLPDGEFEKIFEAAKARVAALEQAELDGGGEALLPVRDAATGATEIEPDAPRVDVPDSRAELIGTRDVLVYAVAMSRQLNERAKELKLGGNIRKRILALYSASVLRLLEKLGHLIQADHITAEAERRKNERDSRITPAHIRRTLKDLRSRHCTCGEENGV